MAAQGSLLIFLLIVVAYVWIMERLDREHGFEEDLS
jgi:putative solute:sodium symporter small subunit